VRKELRNKFKSPGFVIYKKGRTRFAAASDKVYQLPAHGRWFFPGTPTSSTTKTGRHDIAEILLKVALNTIHGQVTGKLYHLRLRVECTFFVIYKAGANPRPIGNRLV
jgi:hypothetical protein